ncbi:MAG: ribose-phosphate diphosphokinase [Gammaproteobacteria bacterium]|jgi:ribose-phosphate pyrophosphokinase
MKAHRNKAMLLGFPEYREPARRLADKAGLTYADVKIHVFPDGESRVSLPPELPKRVVLCRSLHRPNAKLIELEIAATAALQLGARELTLVAPYLCYMRQDAAFHPGEAVSQRIIGELLARRFDTLITVDPHLHRTRRLKDAVPARRTVALSAAEAMAAWLARRHENPLLIGPDAESEQWVAGIAAPGGLEYGVGHKQRLGDREVRIHLPDLPFENRHLVLVDDVASSGNTLAEAARQLNAFQPASISVLVSHALFVDDALARLQAAGVGKICSTDSIPHESNRIHLDGLIAEILAT